MIQIPPRLKSLLGATPALALGFALLTGQAAAQEDDSSPDPDVETLQEQVETLQESVNFLEQQIFEIDERVGSHTLVKAFDGIKLDIGGFTTQVVTSFFDGGAEVSPNQTLFELLLKADVTERVSLFTALGFLREADLDFSDPSAPFFRDSANRVPLIISWVNYAHSDALQFQAGRFVTPHGIINIEHFPPVLLDTNQPQFLRPFSGATIFPNFLDGIQAHGSKFVGTAGDRLSYNIYGGAFTGGDASNIIGGARFAYSKTNLNTTIGLNYSHGRRSAGTGSVGSISVAPAASLTTNEYDTVGVDLLYEDDNILWKNEYFHSLESGEEDRRAFYTQPAWKFNDEWLAFYRYDTLDAGQGLTESTEHVVGVNWSPNSTIRTRLQYTRKDFDDSPNDDADIIQLSVTVSF